MVGVGLLRLLFLVHTVGALNCFVCHPSAQPIPSQPTFDFDTITIDNDDSSATDYSCRHQSVVECVHENAVCRTLIKPNRQQGLVVIGKGCVVVDDPTRVKPICQFLSQQSMVECLCATDECNRESVQAQIVDWMGIR